MERPSESVPCNRIVRFFQHCPFKKRGCPGEIPLFKKNKPLLERRFTLGSGSVSFCTSFFSAGAVLLRAGAFFAGFALGFGFGAESSDSLTTTPFPQAGRIS